MLYPHVTTQEFTILISKFGRPTNTKAQNAKLQELLVTDVVDTLESSHHDLLAKAGKKAIIEELNGAAANVVKKYWEK